MVIAAQNSKHFVQFQKYLLKGGTAGLTLWFPETTWSANHVRKLRHVLSANGLRFWESHDHAHGFIHVDCGGDISAAVKLVHLCFYTVFGLSSETRFKSQPSNTTRPPGGFSGNGAAMRSTLAFHSNGRVICLLEDDWHDSVPYLDRVILIWWFLCFPALWLSFYVNREAVGEWYVNFSSIHAAGNYSTLVLLLLFCGLFGAICWLMYKEESNSDSPELSWLALTCYALACFGLPFAVVLSWFGL